MSIDWGDFDGDGDPDLAVGNEFSSNEVYLNIEGMLWASTRDISFPTVTVGDTVSCPLLLRNRDVIDLDIVGYAPLTRNFALTGGFVDSILNVITLSPGEEISTDVLFVPAEEGDLVTILELICESERATNQITSIRLDGEARGIDFHDVDLYLNGDIDYGSEFHSSIIMGDYVESDSALVYTRMGGKEPYETHRMTKVADPVNDQYVVSIPSEYVSASGIEYFIEVMNGPVKKSTPPKFLRVKVDDYEFPFRTHENRYQMISVPFDMQGTMAGLLVDDLGGPENTRWRMFGYSEESEDYIEVPNDSIGEFEQGRGYWLITRNRRQLDIGPDIGLSANPASEYPITLEGGWNMIGNPFVFPVAWNSILVEGQRMENAQEAGIIEPPLTWVNGREYQDSIDVLMPFVGYWVKSNSEEEMTIQIPPVEYSLPADAADNLQGSKPAITDKSGGSWVLAIIAESCGAVDKCNYLGVGPDRSVGWDNRDRSEPPMSPGRSISLYFPHDRWGERSGCYTADIRGAYAELDKVHLSEILNETKLRGHIWRFDVAKSFADKGAGDTVRLIFAGLECIPDDSIVYLVDRELGRLVDLGQSADYSYYSGTKVRVGEAEARFSLVIGSRNFIDERRDELPEPVEDTILHQNYPNPFNPSTILRYELTEPCYVRLSVFDASGSLVKTVYEGRRQPGKYEEAWYGKNESGRLVAAGIYFSRLETSGGLAQTRKMILIR
jgi:hypothetical protein